MSHSYTVAARAQEFIFEPVMSWCCTHQLLSTYLKYISSISISFEVIIGAHLLIIIVVLHWNSFELC